MKTAEILRHFRNRTTHAARLARWQRLPLAARLAAIREHERPGYPCRPCNSPATMTRADWRKALIDDPAFSHAKGPELSSPESESPYLWTHEDGPEILQAWPGRDFLSHCGWHTDDEGRDTLEAYAVQLEAFPGLIFEAIRESVSGGLRVNLNDWQAIDYSDAGSEYDADAAREEAARDAIRSADSTAEHDAEEEREFQAEEDRKRQAEEAREELATNRAQVRAIIADLRRLCPSDLPTTYPAAAQAVRDRLADLLRDRRDTLDNLRNLTA